MVLRVPVPMLLAIALAACSGAPSVVPQPATTADVAPTQAKEPGSTSSATADPIEDRTLPEPTLTSIDDIILAMGDPTQAGNIVVSMLAQLGIGLYRADGTPIRKGTETSDADFYVFEPMAQGLVAMLRHRDDDGELTSFRDFHGGLVSLGYEGSAEELATAFADAYAAQPDAPIARLVDALGPVTIDGTYAEFELWLLTLDGFIQPNGGATAMAMADTGIPLTAAGGVGWGVAHARIRPSAETTARASIVAQLKAIISAWQIILVASPTDVHEGHDGSHGSPATIRASLLGPTSEIHSPFGGDVVIAVPLGPSGAHVGWALDDTATSHGVIEDFVSEADGAGTASTNFIPHKEAANGRGTERSERGAVKAKFEYRDLAEHLYGSFATPYAEALHGWRENHALVVITFHEVPEGEVRILWTNEYDEVPDTITFVGSFDTFEIDPATGNAAIFIGHGTATGSRAAWAACNPGITDVPGGTSTATFQGIIEGDSIVISAYVDFGQPLVGISTAPIEVSLTGGTGYFTGEGKSGTVCKDWQLGTLTYTPTFKPTTP